MAKSKLPELMTIEAIKKIAKVTDRKSDHAEMVAVKVTARTCTDNGVTHGRGETFDMEISLVPVHVQYGQVEIVKKA